MTQQIINVGAAPNDGQGDPIRTAFTKCNNNFDELYARVQVDPPPTLVGSVGDVAGMTAYDENFYYYCFQDFDGSSQIWNKVPQTGNAQVTLLTATGNITGNYFIGNGSQLTGVVATAPTSIVNGTSNVVVQSSGNVTISVAGNPNVITVLEQFPGVVGLLVTGQFVTTQNANVFGSIQSGDRITAVANITGSNIIANSGLYASTLTLTGNVTSNLNLSSNLAVGGNLSIVGNITQANVTGNVSAQNLTAVGNITTSGGFFIGDGGFLSNVTAVSNVAVDQIANGTTILSIAGSGGNIIMTVDGTANLILFQPGGMDIAGNIDATGNIDGANVNSDGRMLAVGNITGGNLTTGGRVVASGNIDGLNLNLNQQVIATGNISGGNINTTGQVVATGNITGGNLSGTLITGTLSTAAQPNITSVGSLTSLTVTGNISSGAGATTINTLITTTGNITGGNLITGGLLSATGNVIGGNIITSGLINSTGNIDGGNLNTGGRVLATGNVTGGNLTTGGQIVTTGNITGNNVIATATISATGNITGGNLSVNSGAISAGTLTVSNILNAGANGTGNIGNSTNYFNTVFAKATSAQYADLAEKYLADAEYVPGTVLSFGGSREVTLSTQDHDPLIVGVVSTNPAYQMNSRLEGEHVVAVALVGRVPCQVQGPVTRGAMMVSAGNGRARAEAHPAMGTVIGKALEDFDGDQGTIEIVVGRL